MRKSVMEALFPAARRRVLGTVLLDAGKEWYLSDLAAKVGLSVSSLQKEVRLLTDVGILRERRDGNRVYYSANPDCAAFSELQAIFRKLLA